MLLVGRYLFSVCSSMFVFVRWSFFVFVVCCLSIVGSLPLPVGCLVLFVVCCVLRVVCGCLRVGLCLRYAVFVRRC